jgi:hypothetical protein
MPKYISRFSGDHEEGPKDSPGEAVLKKLTADELKAAVQEIERQAGMSRIDADAEANAFKSEYKNSYVDNKASATAMVTYLMSKGYKAPFTKDQLRQAFEDLVDLGAVAFKERPKKLFDEGDAYTLSAEELRQRAGQQMRGEL